MILIMWMAYATVLGAISAGAAIAIERLVEIWGGARRFVWIGALLFCVITPLVLALRPVARAEPAATATPESVPTIMLPHERLVAPARTAPVPVRFSSETLARPVAALWVAASIALLVLIARGFWIVRRNRSRWTEEVIDGQHVLVSDDVGPAVVGAWTPSIVVPRWVLSLADDERRMMLVHEVEHVAAGDSRVLLGAALALALTPWNAALWLIVQRLRLAIEIDCDARVLRTIARPREYGMLLLSVGARTARALPLAASLAERRPLLERRIIAMTSLRPTRPVIASLPFAALALLAVTAVAQTPAPASLAPAVWKPAHADSPITATQATPAQTAARAEEASAAIVASEAIVPAMPALAPATPVNDLEAVRAPEPSSLPAIAHACCDISDDSIAAWIMSRYPNVVRGDTTVGGLVFIVDAAGKLVTTTSRTPAEFAAMTGDAPGGRGAGGASAGAVMRGRVGGGGSGGNGGTVAATAAPGGTASGGRGRGGSVAVATTTDSVRIGAYAGPREQRFVSGAQLQGKAFIGDFELDGDAIDGIHVTKFGGASQFSPKPIGIMVFFMKPGR